MASARPKFATREGTVSNLTPQEIAAIKAGLVAGAVPNVTSATESTATFETRASSANPDAAAIEKAYEDQLIAMFKVLVANLASTPASHDTEQGCVDKFALGVKLARRARELALKVVAPPSIS
jgi:hypothetical protein